MGAGDLVFRTLVSFNRFLYKWMHKSSHKLFYAPRARPKLDQRYDAVLQEFVLIKTQYKVLSNVLKAKAKTSEQEFTVKVLE